jgi:hypothetical protein
MQGEKLLELLQNFLGDPMKYIVFFAVVGIGSTLNRPHPQQKQPYRLPSCHLSWSFFSLRGWYSKIFAYFSLWGGGDSSMDTHQKTVLWICI